MNDKTKNTLPGWILWLGLFSATYFIVGRLSLLLALPPGYATAIFPPAGLALAILLIRGQSCWLAVWLGSFALNVWVSDQAGTAGSVSDYLIAASIASGAALQAIIGAWLIRRFVGYPSAFAGDKQVFRFLFLGGPLSCLLNATIGPLSLLASGTISTDAYLLTSWTWWVGDTLGVLVMTPILLTLFGAPAQVWRSRRLPVALPLMTAFILVTLLFTRASYWENQEIHHNFLEHAEIAHRDLEAQFARHIEVLHSIERLFVTTDVINQQQFSDFVKPTLESHTGIQALAWMPRVARVQRADFETLSSRLLNRPYVINEKTPARTTLPATSRNEYFPVLYASPVAKNAIAPGFDIGSDPTLLEAINIARDAGKPAVTRRVTLVQEEHDQYGLVVLQPVYATGALPVQPEARHAALLGFATGVFRLKDLIEAGLPDKYDQDFDVYVYDPSAQRGQQLLYSSIKYNASSPHSDLTWETTLQLGDRRFSLRFTPTAAYLSKHRGWQAWMVMAGGMLFISLLGAYLLTMSGRTLKVQELVDQRTRELQESHAMVGAIVDNAIEAIITVNDYGIIESFNPAAEQLFGYRAQSVMGQKFSQFNLVLNESVAQAPEHGRPDAAIAFWTTLVGIRKEINGRRNDGSIVPLEISVSELHLGERRLYTGIMHDLSERKKVERMKDEFVSTVSHELRTPLTSIRASLDLIAAGVTGALPDKATMLIKIAGENAKRLSALIDDILDIEKIEFGNIKFNLSPQLLMPIIQEAVIANAGFAFQHKVDIDIELAAQHEIQVDVDKNRLIQILNNLISNAIKFSPAPGRITVRVEAYPETVRVCVQDWGCGIPEKFRARIFSKFAQADSSDTRKIGGTGLGLSICKALVEKMGGQIDYISDTNGKGSTFFFELPYNNTRTD